MDNKSTQLLNKVKDRIVEFANENNISLADHFETVDDFKKFTIALTFKLLTDSGLPAKEAHDMIFGDGQYDLLVDKLWNNAKA